MKESYRKGLASHPDPESCVGSRKAAIEALTGAHAGQAIELRNHRDPECRRRSAWRKATPTGRYREPPADSAQSETPGMHGNSTRENRETPSTPAARSRRAGRRRP